jgi:tetratricopeptide (TPR) repeat protein
MFPSRTFWIALVSVTLSATAAAQPAPETGKDPTKPTEIAKERARALHRDGAALYLQGQYEKALAAFTAAWALIHHADLAGNLAECEIKLGRFRDAAEHVQYILDDPTASKRLKDNAVARMRDVSAHVATVRVTLSEPTATLTIGGREVPRSALGGPLFLDPGDHVFLAKERGFRDATATKTLTAGASETVALVLAKEAPAPPPGPAASASGATPPPPTPGPGASEELAPTTVVLVAGGATVAVATALGITFSLIASGKASDADDQLAALDAQGLARPCGAPSTACAEIDDARNAADDLGTAALGSFIGAGVALAGTGALYLWFSGEERAESAVRVGAASLPGGGVVSVGGAF